MNTLINKKFIAVVAVTFIPLLTNAQEQIAHKTVFSNALFNTLLGIIIFLLIVAMGLSQVLKNLAKSDLFLELKANKEKNNDPQKIAGVVLLCMTGFMANAQDEKVNQPWLVGGLEMSTFLFMLAIIIVELLFIGSLFRTLKYLLRNPEAKAPVVEVKKEKSILERLNASVEIEKEAEIMMGHEYDGIRELDNDLPPWWRYGFYLTILVSVIYLIHYHIANTGDLQLTEYQKEIEEGKAEVARYMKEAAANVDETTVTMMEGTDLENGKSLFISSCASCHGKLGEGGVGPNLTDNYWLHGGSIQDIFKSVKYGWADKGMKSWKEDLSPMQIAQISSFIKSIQGTNPPNAKPQQGDIYIEEPPAKLDSTLTASVKADTLSVTK